MLAAPRRLWLGLLTLTACVAAGGLVWSTEVDLARSRDLHGAPHAGADACRRCHPSHFESWRRTFHGRMTQRASEQSVLGDFDGAPLSYFGVHARAVRADDGSFRFEYARGYGPPEGDRVVRTVGSRRVQQYLAERDGVLVRLPWAWHVEDARWFHMNGAFLTPDPDMSPTLALADFERHLVRWNDNCIFCHNVAPNPGKRGAHFDSQVAELGVACEACHGPAQGHAERNANPFRRYRLHLSDVEDPLIVNPARLDPERAADVCGRCHGQRITDDLDAFLREGDPFVPGDDLARYSAPLWRDTPLNGAEGVFSARFWTDGTARLTAYEYQGLLQSPCAQRGELTCLSCHAMHEGDPRGQLRPDRLGARMCTPCHEGLSSRAAQQEHARHEDVTRTGCVDCHMPKVVYGVMQAHRSHRIEVPAPARQAAHTRPDACTLCHVQRSREWAAEARARLWGAGGASRFEDPGPTSEIERSLLSGDPIERALAAAALASGHAPDPAARAQQNRLLLSVMQHERYPAVRRLAWQALGARLDVRSAPAYARYRADAPLRDREPVVRELREHIGLPPPSGAFRRQVEELRASAPKVEIHIGE